MINRSSCSLEPSQPRTKRRILFVTKAGLSLVFLAALLPAVSKAHPADAPSWMHALTSAPLPKHDEKTEAVLLYSEEILTVQPNGKLKELDRRVYKILRPSGRHLGTVKISFDQETKVSHIRGWCIPAQGKDYEVKDKEVGEDGLVGIQGGELFSDHRTKVMQIPAADPGNIIGYEIEQEGRPYILQDEWAFQDIYPVGVSRYTLLIPQGWEYKAVWVNHSEVAPASVGSNQWTWEMKDLPGITPEEYMPPWHAIAGVMLVALIPPGGMAHGFLTWSEMGAWQNSLLQGREGASPEIKQKVSELIANAKTPMAQMVALADFMQKDIRYVGIWLGIGGWQPHAAPQVFSNRYGDCKDKATLLSVMLREIGIKSYYVVIDSERGGVTPAIPPHLGLFDHVVLAIHLPDGVEDPRLKATLQHPKLGRLLIFDPTDELTPFGSLSGELQASYALLVTPEGGELAQMPQLSPSTTGILRTTKLTLDAQGSLRGEVQDEYVGDSAWWMRGRLRYVEKDSDRLKIIEHLVSGSLGSFSITKAGMTNLQDSSKPFLVEYSLVAQAYAKSAGDLLLVRPRVIGIKTNGILETKEPRAYPVEFPGPQLDRDSFEITLPSGYEVDELPPPTDIDFPFASYHSKTVAQGNILKYTRTFEIKQLSVPASQADDLKKFFRIIGNDERSTAVLKPAGH